ncbi:DUF7059 domain-containing protein [Nocardioides zeae]
MTATSTLPHRLREALSAAGFTYDAVADLLGSTAHAALARNQTAPGLARTADGSPLATLTRLFLLQTAVTRAEAEAALPDLVDRLAVEGFLETSVGEVRARLDCRPYAAPDAAGDHDLWVASDLTPGLDGLPNRVSADHVLGISSASTSLAQLTLRDDVVTALDLGTGCGVQALHLATHAARVVATDVNPRALRLARFNAALNDLTGIEVRDGSYFEPVRDERFDLIATNPPFVISPGTGERLVYRDSGLPGDRVVEDIVRSAPRHLTPGGWCQVLANWVITDGTPWDERLAGWLGPTEEGIVSDAFVVQREVLDPAAYVELWLADEGAAGTADYLRRYDTWLSWFADQGIEGSASAGSTCGAGPTVPQGRRRCAWRSGPTRSSSRSPPRSEPGVTPSTTSHVSTTTRSSPLACGPGPTCARSPSASRARPTRRPSCSGSSGASAGVTPPTP